MVLGEVYSSARFKDNIFLYTYKYYNLPTYIAFKK